MRGCDNEALRLETSLLTPPPDLGSAAAKRPCPECSHLGLAKLADAQPLAHRRESGPTPQKRGAAAF